MDKATDYTEITEKGKCGLYKQRKQICIRLMANLYLIGGFAGIILFQRSVAQEMNNVFANVLFISLIIASYGTYVIINHTIVRHVYSHKILSVIDVLLLISMGLCVRFH